MKLLATPIGWLLSQIYGIVDNYGLSICILTFLMRLCLYPLFSKQIESNAQQAAIQAEIKDIQYRYAADKEEMNRKLAELYSDRGYNPAAGCLPTMIQLPILFGLIALLRAPLTYMTSPEMIMAVHESFFWVSDLCQPDTWILPILAAVTTYINSVATTAGSPELAENGMMEAMKYFSPIMILLLGRSFPAGIALYWGVSNLFSIFQTLALNKKRKAQEFKRQAEIEAAKRMDKQKRQAK